MTSSSFFFVHLFFNKQLFLYTDPDYTGEAGTTGKFLLNSRVISDIFSFEEKFIYYN